MKLKLANGVALCLFALSSSAGSESPSQGGDNPDDVLAEMDPFIQSLAEATPRPTPAAAMSDQRREALERANERINEAEERVEAADRRLRWLEGSSEEAARASAEAAALIRERWPEIVERTRSIVGSMSDKQSDAVSEAVLRSQAASDREEASRQVLEALIGDRGDAPFREGEGELGACTFLKAGETYFKARCDNQATFRNRECLIGCTGLAGAAEDECLVNCEEQQKSELEVCAAIGESCVTEDCCLLQAGAASDGNRAIPTARRH